MTIITEAPDLTPGAMQETLTRELPGGGLIEFEFAPYGWLTQAGETRQEDYRAYHFTPQPTCLECEGTGRVPSTKRPGGTIKCAACKGTGDAKRQRMVSVTTLLDSICPKGGLPVWAEARGIEGAVRAMALGELGAETDPADAVKLVRYLKLGADRARDDAASRGLNVHRLNECYMATGATPALSEHPPEHHGYIRAWCSWLLARDPEPLVVEGLVCDPDAGYAGRRDFVGLTAGCRVGYDFKSQEKGCIYSSAHLQLRLYERGAVACGDEPCDQLNVVVFAENGEWREMACAATNETTDRALAYYEAIKPIDGVCESWNRAERKARA